MLVAVGFWRSGRWPSSRCALAAALALAADRVRSLGHALVAGTSWSRSGSLIRRREALETAGVIGWNLRSTWFQRRAGLTTLVATTAGGQQSVTALDVPEDDARRRSRAPPYPGWWSSSSPDARWLERAEPGPTEPE